MKPKNQDMLKKWLRVTFASTNREKWSALEKWLFGLLVLFLILAGWVGLALSPYCNFNLLAHSGMPAICEPGAAIYLLFILVAGFFQ